MSLQAGQIMAIGLIAVVLPLRALQLVRQTRLHARRLRERRARSEGIVSREHPNVKTYRF